MIESWKHKGLKRFFETGNTSGIQFKHALKIKQQLEFLDSAKKAEDLNLPSYAFHRLTGKLKQYYAISVDGGWRIIFKFENGNAFLVDYLNYH